MPIHLTNEFPWLVNDFTNHFIDISSQWNTVDLSMTRKCVFTIGISICFENTNQIPWLFLTFNTLFKNILIFQGFPWKWKKNSNIHYCFWKCWSYQCLAEVALHCTVWHKAALLFLHSFKHCHALMFHLFLLIRFQTTDGRWKHTAQSHAVQHQCIQSYEYTQ